MFLRPPYTRLKGIGQAPYFPLGIGYLTAVVNSIEGIEARLYYPENTPAGESGPIIDKKGVFDLRSAGQKRYFEALREGSHAVWSELLQVLRTFKPDVVGISLLTPEVASAAACIDIVKRDNPSCFIICGGVHPTFEPHGTLDIPGVDCVVMGEGETAMVQVAEAIRDGLDPAQVPGVITRHSPERHFTGCAQIDALDSIPFPARSSSFFPERFSDVALGSIMHSRGCPWRCGFCSSRRFWQEKVRFRKAERVVEEIEAIRSEFGIRTFTFWDDAFTIDAAITGELCEAILAMKHPIAWRTATRQDLLDDRMIRLMKRAGCVQLELGIETGSPRMLELIRKDIDLGETPGVIDRVNRHGIACGVFLMAGFPDESEEDLMNTLAFIRRIHPAEIVLNIFDPMPGSEQFERGKELGVVPREVDFMNFRYWPDAHYAAGVSRERFNELIERMSRYVFQYNTSLPALKRRALPELTRLIRIDRKALFRKGIRFLSHRLFGH